MALLHFRKPDNALEDGGRDGLPVQEDALEPELTCPECRHSTPVSRLQSRYMVCSCGYHFRMNARERIRMIVDRGTFQEMFSDVAGDDPLKFPGYPEKLETARAASGENEAVICGTGTIGKMPCAFFFMEPGFMMGSMGTAVGERITRTFELARERNLPVVGFTVSGGARMQEGLLSLMQMAKVSGAVRRHSDAGLLYIAVLTDPTTGGVTASFAMQADITLCEPGATVGFAGKRIVEQATGKKLPKNFQKAESVEEEGFIDRIVPRQQLKPVLTQLLAMHCTGGERT
ncbi:MAG: acetyl-CoA carboxylase carboxyl transferase subunit beta [Lachnospiraceae bacterium]|nr:acetyl-CoA carboxylase carboxyl transferase subunit beta [Lachnospiraceae bacterium]MCH4030208.1 acetyl-CoA carboxylase carboxyl transferase subunit beta [Lachnospiraceae bacterium]MCH4069420.1 acetyl-CoA carboxylase carboxyl transferase subunit beta [Lachnospiraceae bacterium]MCH4107644.1 acetyl-CoA carboxylase carboxyl transferase subunit beta [Lachnospiraceae bacterium]MCI1301505.1 acetyl-CoA carboxylase carboxyl transferase subunit beta [Lachnospiraceae bacterium]